MAAQRKQTTHIVVYRYNTEDDVGAFEIGRKQRSQGALSIGYHFVIRKDGTVEDGRPVAEIGLHDKKLNRVSIAIICVGKESTPAQDSELNDLIASIQTEYPGTTIVKGHT